MNNATPQNKGEEKIKEAALAFKNFMSTLDEFSNKQRDIFNKTNRKLELTQIERLKKQISEEQ